MITSRDLRRGAVVTIRSPFVLLLPGPHPAQGLQRALVAALDAFAAQRELASLQGVGHIWFCGAYFGYGFHEDGLKAGLAAAEAIGGVERPWRLEGASGLARRTP